MKKKTFKSEIILERLKFSWHTQFYYVEVGFILYEQ